MVSIYEKYDVGTGESARRTGNCGTSGTSETSGRLGKAERTARAGASGTGECSTFFCFQVGCWTFVLR